MKTQEEFIKELFEKYKDLPKRDGLICGGYEIIDFDAYKLKDDCQQFVKQYIETVLPKVEDIDSEEYHTYFKNCLILKYYAEAMLKNIPDKYSLRTPRGTEVRTGQRD